MTYENMRDSGFPWIGKIPDHWHLTKTLHCLSMAITDGPHTTPALYDNGVPFISAEAVSCGNGRIDFSHMRGYISEEFYAECCKKYIPQIDDVYMIKSGATTGRVAIVDTNERFTIWSPLAVFRANPDRVLPKFLFYALQSESYQKQVELGWTYGTQQNIGMRTLETLTICLPPLGEQDAIVSYLDRQCATTDSIIEDAKASIEDYKRWKASMIYQAVTKGLNPNADMRESGIDIVGIVPADWQMVRLRFLCNVMTGDQDTQNAVPDGNYPFYVRSPIVERADTFTFEGESVLMAGDGVGAGKVFHYAKGKYAIHQRVYCFYNFRNIKPSFFYYYMSNLFSTEIDKGSAKSTVPSVRLPMLSNFRIALPSIQEQDAICEYLDKRTEQIDAIIAEKQSIIAELEAYKKSLIYETVTGKRKAE